MKTIAVIATVLENEAEAKKFLRDVGVRAPSLHPHVGSPDAWKRWNGWNHAKAIGTDADGGFVEIESWHFASGSVDYSVSANGSGSRLSTGAFNDVRWPIQVFPAIAIIRHPEHTPSNEKSPA